MSLLLSSSATAFLRPLRSKASCFYSWSSFCFCASNSFLSSRIWFVKSFYSFSYCFISFSFYFNISVIYFFDSTNLEFPSGNYSRSFSYNYENVNVKLVDCFSNFRVLYIFWLSFSISSNLLESFDTSKTFKLAWHSKFALLIILGRNSPASKV